jgi:hypothetical protein
MKERLVRGTNLIGVVRILRAHKENQRLPELGAWEKDLMRKRVSPSTWYSLQVFDSLLQVVHRYVYDGSEAAAQNMGRIAARNLISEEPARVFVPGKPLDSLYNMGSRWREVFNFGEINVVPVEPGREHGGEDGSELEEGRQGARVRLAGFPDMSACIGHNIMGWSLEVVENAGGKEPSLKLEERPWMHNNVLTYVISWS